MEASVTTAICYDVIFSNWGWGSPILFETICHSTFVSITFWKHHTFVGDFFSETINNWWKCWTWEIPSSISITPLFQELTHFKWWALTAVWYQTDRVNQLGIIVDLAVSAVVFCTQHMILLIMARYRVKLISVFQLIYAFLNFWKH